MQNDITTNKISKGKCHISHFDTWHEAVVLHFHFAPPTPSCTREGSAARLTGRSDEQPGCITWTKRGGRTDVRGARPLYPLSEERCPLTSVPVVGGICLKAAGSKWFRFDINLPELKASRLSQIIKEASQI